MSNDQSELALSIADLVPMFFLGLLVYGVAEFIFLRRVQRD